MTEVMLRTVTVERVAIRRCGGGNKEEEENGQWQKCGGRKVTVVTGKG